MQELEHRLRHRIRLRQHRRAGLDEDVLLGVVGAFRRDIHVSDLTVGGREVVLQRAELVLVVTERFLVGTNVRTVRRELGDGGLDTGQRRLGATDGGDVTCGRRRVAGGPEVDPQVAERVAFAVRGHVERVAIEQADTVERLRRHVVDVGTQGCELLLIQGPVARGFGDVLCRHREFTHACQRTIHLLQITVLRLVE